MNTVDLNQASRLLTREGASGRRLEATSHEPKDSVSIEGLAIEACVSDDGRYVAFVAQGKAKQWFGNPTAGNAGRYDVYLKDRREGTLTCLSQELPQSSSGLCMSADGKKIAFSSLTQGSRRDILLYDEGGLRNVTSELDSNCHAPALSADGQVLAFVTTASNAAPDVPGFQEKAVVKELATGRTEVVSRTVGGEPARGMASEIALSGDGSQVAFVFTGYGLDSQVTTKRSPFSSFEPIIPQVYVRDRSTNQTRQASRNEQNEAADSSCLNPRLSRDGKTLAFTTAAGNLAAGDLAGKMAVYLACDGELARVLNGTEGAREVSLSSDGQWLAWEAGSEIQLRSKDGEELTVDHPPTPDTPYSQLNPAQLRSPRLSGEGNTVVFLQQQPDRDVFDGMQSKVFTFDCEHARAQLAWVDSSPTSSSSVQTRSDSVTIGGVRLRRR